MLLGFCLLHGCLLPPPIEPGQTTGNHPPRINPDNLTPPVAELPKMLSVICSKYDFYAEIEDPDPDTLYWRKFLDYAKLTDPQRLQSTVTPRAPAVDATSSSAVAHAPAA